MLGEMCGDYLLRWLLYGIVIGFLPGYETAKYLYKRKIHDVVSAFRLATNKPTFTLEELLYELKRLGGPIGR